MVVVGSVPVMVRIKFELTNIFAHTHVSNQQSALVSLRSSRFGKIDTWINCAIASAPKIYLWTERNLKMIILTERKNDPSFLNFTSQR
jgi:hypothetical protein